MHRVYGFMCVCCVYDRKPEKPEKEEETSKIIKIMHEPTAISSPLFVFYLSTFLQNPTHTHTHPQTPTQEQAQTSPPSGTTKHVTSHRCHHHHCHTPKRGPHQPRPASRDCCLPPHREGLSTHSSCQSLVAQGLGEVRR